MLRAVGACVFAISIVWPMAIWPDDPLPFPDFEHKSVKVPAAGSRNLINVQIDPAAPFASLRAATQSPAITPSPSSAPFGWFWDQVSSNLGAPAGNRLEDAVNVLRNLAQDNGFSAPRVQTVQKLVDRFGTDILISSVGTDVSPALVLAVIAVESGGRADSVSPAGAVGVMQLIPATAARFGVVDSKKAADNIRGGVAYLDWLMKEFDGDPVMVLAAYNAGENAVRGHGGVPEYSETRAYVPKVLAAWSVARLLCLTPPELVSDGCVFAKYEAQN